MSAGGCWGGGQGVVRLVVGVCFTTGRAEVKEMRREWRCARYAACLCENSACVEAGRERGEEAEAKVWHD